MKGSSLQSVDWGLLSHLGDVGVCYSLDLECPPEVHVLEAGSPVRQCAEAGRVEGDGS